MRLMILPDVIAVAGIAHGLMSSSDIAKRVLWTDDSAAGKSDGEVG